MKTIFRLSFLLLTSILHAQFKPLLPSQLPDSLKRGADAVVQECITEVRINSVGSMQVIHKQWVTVLNEEGRKAVRTAAYYDKGTKIKDLEAELFDAGGNSIKKYRAKDFQDYSAVSGGTLYGDSRVKYLHYTPQSYPFTLYFSYEEENGNTAFLPKWYPIPQYGVSVMSCRMDMSYPEGLKPRFREQKLAEFGVRKEVSSKEAHFHFPPRAALRQEQLSPPIYSVGPSVWSALNSFTLENVKGSATDWKSFGLWYHDKLIRGRDQLPEETLREVAQMVKGITDPRQKAQKIYDYVQKNTRYISVQLGIGGWQPISAEEVDQVKYGDCKGLTNYTKALLESQGIESYYALVWAGPQKRDMTDDFAVMQGNHAILNIPLEGEDVWLECTSQTLPFNYLGDFTDDRMVLLVTPNGGELKRTHRYLDEQNLYKSEVEFSISAEGHFKGKTQSLYEGIAYDQYFGIQDLNAKEVDERYKDRWSTHTDLNIMDYRFQDDPDAIRFEESVQLESRNYGQFVGEELLFRVNPLNQNTFVPDRVRNRRTAFSVSRGYKEELSVTFELPNGYEMEDLPPPVLLASKYGLYRSSIKRNENGSFHYSRTFLLNHGEYSADEYEAYRKFRRKVASHDRARLAAQKV